MRKMTVSLPLHPYDVYFDAGLLRETGALLRAVKGAGRVALVMGEDDEKRYAKAVAQSLEAAGFLPSVLTMPAGRACRTLDAAAQLCNQFAALGLSRGDTVAALGGSAVCDVTGFAAAIYLRGVDYIVLPTTLRAQAGAAVGGETVVQIPGGEPLAGAFYQPRLVVCDTDCLTKLSSDARADGVAEIIRTGMVMDAVLLSRLEKGMTPESMAERCCKQKIALVEQDEFMRGAQKILAFGGAVGDVLETVTGCTYGQALSAGMTAMLRLTEQAGLLQDPTLPARLEALFARFSLPVRIPCDFDALWSALLRGLRRTTGDAELVLVSTAGCAQLCRVPKEALQELLRAVL